MVEDKPYFMASDIAKALGYAKPNDAISQHCRATVKHSTPISGKMQEVNFIPEGDIYRLIIKSQLPASDKFERWIFDEVLPTIRKTGGYVNNDDLFINTYLPYADEQTRVMFRSQLEVIKSLNHQIEHNKPKVIFADAVTASQTTILIGELAKIMRQNGIDIGEKRLFAWLRDNGYLIKRKGTDYNSPTQKSMEMGLFEVKETAITHAHGNITVSKTTKATGKGQVYFINKFMEGQGAKSKFNAKTENRL